MTGYSGDLRERVIRSGQNGHKPAWIAAEYNMGFSTVKRYITRFKRLGHNRAIVQKRPSGQFTAEQLTILTEQVREHDDATIEEHRGFWNERQAFQVSRPPMPRPLQKPASPPKKNPVP